MRPLELMRQEAIDRVGAEIDLSLFVIDPHDGPAGLSLRREAAMIESGSTPRAPTAFLSYAWEGDALKLWVQQLATRLRADGVDVKLDQWNAAPGDQLPAFMEASIRENDFVLVICTPTYKQKSDNRRGGVGYEGSIMTGELMTLRNERKFIPILRLGDWKDSAASWLSGKYHLDFRGDPYPPGQYQDLVATLYNRRPAPPPLGRSPFDRSDLMTPAGADTAAEAQPAPTAADEPVRILGIAVDEVGTPVRDGTRGSALYSVPFRLSQSPTSQWADMFVRTWDRPPVFTTRHRPGIARVLEDRIILNGTTVEEIEEVHRDTLTTVLRDVNDRYAKLLRQAREEQDQKAREANEHSKRVRDAAERLRFE